MVQLDYFGHQSPRGDDIRTVARKFKYEYLQIGENLAVGYESAEKLIDQWMGSTEHRNNILHPLYTKSSYSITLFRENTLITAIFSLPTTNTIKKQENNVEIVPLSIPNPDQRENASIIPFFSRYTHLNRISIFPEDILGSLLYLPQY